MASVCGDCRPAVSPTQHLTQAFEVSAHQVNCQLFRAVLPSIGGVLCPKLALALGMSAPAQNESTKEEANTTMTVAAG
ncbi:hypothetical protein PC119_g21246 [Phytophthora cactorum]|nr:hypothetical protein PC119_g21246 [Phytophthora cactorum]